MEYVPLRPYQERLMSALREDMRNNKHIALRLQQGGGKSYLIAAMAERSIRNGNRVLVLSHRRQITRQNAGLFGKYGIPLQVIMPDTKTIDTEVGCYVAMSQTLQSRVETKPEFIDLIKSCSVVLIDEGHMQYNDWVFDYISDDAWVIGFSGTWSRTGKQQQLGLLYDKITYGVGAEELLSLGYLVPSVCYGFDAPDLTGVEWSYSSGDWNQRQLSARFRKKTRYAGILKEWLRLTPNTQTIIYTTSAEHCVELCSEFVNAGIKAKYVLSKKMPDTDSTMSGPVNKVLDDFEKYKFQVLVNVDMLGVGYNNPGIQTVILDFSTESYANYSQKAARGGRPDKRKSSYTILDFGDNVRKFGKPEEDRLQVLWHNELKGGGIAATKECPGCKRLIHLSYRECPQCGYKFLTEKEIYEVELVKIADQVTQPTQKETLQAYVARNILDGKNTNWILMNVCIRNADNAKKAFMEAIEIMRTKHGKSISPKYWYFFKKNILRDKLVKK